MFTGIVKQMGEVVALEPRDAGARLTVRALGPGVPARRGDSVCVSGVCLTALEAVTGGAGDLIAFDAIAQTLTRSMLGGLKPGDRVNLEPALTASEPMGGHVVQGHVDAVGRVARVQINPGDWRVRVELPADGDADAAELRDAMVPRGSVTIDGVSLTLADVADDGAWIEVALIPETLERTTLGQAAAGDSVNLEADVLTKTVVRKIARMGAALPAAPERPAVSAALLMSAGWGAGSLDRNG